MHLPWRGSRSCWWGRPNTALVSRIALRWGLRAATVAGSLYAVSYAAANTEYLTLLEPLGTLCLLGGVALLLRSAEPAASAWWTYGGGAVLGLGLVVKIWDVVPVLVVLGWLTVTSGRVAAVRAGLAAVVSASVAVLPFAVEAGHRMLRLVVLDQLGRPRGPADLATRLGGVSGVDLDAGPVPAASRPVLLAVALGVVVLTAAIAWTSRRGRLWVVMLAAQRSSWPCHRATSCTTRPTPSRLSSSSSPRPPPPSPGRDPWLS